MSFAMLKRALRRLSPAAFLIVVAALPRPASAHCDTLDGPVVAAARVALEAHDVTPVLKWVSGDDEPALRAAFAYALEVRALSDPARELADHYFFETLVRLHRAAEGFPFNGLAPAGAPVPPAVRGADAALASGDVDALAGELAAAVERGVRERFARALETRRHAEDSVAAGRAFVAAYVSFTHYAERLEELAVGHGAQGGHGEPMDEPRGEPHGHGDEGAGAPRGR